MADGDDIDTMDMAEIQVRLHPVSARLGLGVDQFLAGGVSRTVVHEQDFEIATGQRRRDFARQRHDIASLVIGRDNN